MKAQLVLYCFNYGNQYKDYSVRLFWLKNLAGKKKTMVVQRGKKPTVCKVKTVKYKAGKRLFVLP